jgi:hypothetical protein
VRIELSFAKCPEILIPKGSESEFSLSLPFARDFLPVAAIFEQNSTSGTSSYAVSQL